ncbi:MAG: ATP-binding protein [Myxococcota bacterium]|nr:ATP-binding protein [Myxococcota bacterium]
MVSRPLPTSSGGLNLYLGLRLILMLAVLTAVSSGIGFETNPDGTLASPHQWRLLYIAGGLTLVGSLLGLFQVQIGAPRRLTVTTQMLIDATAVATVVAGTGAEESPFSFVFLLVIMNGVNLEGRAGAFISALAVCVAFAADITLTGNRGEWYVHLPSPAELGTWLTHVAAFFSAAWLGSVLEDRAAKVRVALAELEDIHEQVVESLPHGLLVTSSDGRVSMENPTARSMLAQGTLIGKLIHEALPALGQAPNSGEREVVHRVGQERRVLRCSFKPLGDGTLVTLENFTNLRGMEQRVIQSESLAGVGRMASGLAHELRNPLGNLMGATQEMIRDDSDAELRTQLGGIILQEGTRLNTLVEDFLIFARPRKPVLVPALLETVIQEVTEAYSQGPAGRRNPVFVRPGGDHSVAMDVIQMHQLLQNLLVNASAASEEGEPVEVSTARMIGDQGATDQVVVSIADRGYGMKPDEVVKIFEPFYSRRRGGGGSGLGLAIVMRIVHDHGGHIEVDSEPETGTRFHVFLPICHGENP